MDNDHLHQTLDLLERARTASELLEAIDADRTILDSLPAGESGRLLRAIDRANNPDNRTRRRQLKAMAREARAARVRKDDDVLQATTNAALDTSRSVGWFTTLYPVRLEPGPLGSSDRELGESIRGVKEAT